MGDISEDELNRRVKQAVREALADERRQVSERETRAHQGNTRARLRAELSALEKRPRTWLGLAGRRMRIAFLVSLVFLLVGLVFPVKMALGAAGLSPSAFALCPVQCEGCTGPGKQFLWSYRGSWKSNKGSMGMAHVCSHPSLNLESMTWFDVSKRNDELQPYIISGFAMYPFEAFALATIIATLFGVLGTSGSLKRQAARREELSRQLEK